MASRAIAEKYKALGFEVIEGGRSTKRVVVNSVKLAENFGKQHRHVLRDIEQFKKTLGPDLDSVICTHIRKSHYFDRTGRKLPCYDLTQIGFEAIALGYDAALRFKYVLAFHELQQELGLEARSIIAGVTERLQEITSGWVQPELDLNADLEHAFPADAPTADDDPDPDDEARHQWIEEQPIICRDELPQEQTPEAWQAWAREQWFRLPLKIRQQWWRDTDYGKRTPSPEMIQAIIAIALP